MNIDFNVLVGKVFTSIDSSEYEITFHCDDGTSYKMLHYDYCCESVTVESIIGDLNDLIGSPILLAESSTGYTTNDYKFKYEPESYTSTFYKLATVKGYVDIRWFGESNGYYSESVDFVKV